MSRTADKAVYATLEHFELVDAGIDHALTLNGYQALAQRTGEAWDAKPRDEHRLLLACGLAGETGEIADNLKKEVGHGHDYDDAKLLEELGDALWYLSEVARKHGFPLSVVAAANVAKIERRYPGGFTERASQDRA